MHSVQMSPVYVVRKLNDISAVMMVCSNKMSTFEEGWQTGGRFEPELPLVWKALDSPAFQNKCAFLCEGKLDSKNSW